MDVVVIVLLGIFIFLFFREVIRRKNYEKDVNKLIGEARVDAIKRSKASIEGQVYEQLVPHLPNWKHVPSDARFIGTPIDYIVFDGMSEGEPTQITIVEVKKGKSSTTKLQRKIRDLIKDGKITWELFKIK